MLTRKVSGHRHRFGFTLTEAAIVLGIVGLILGAVWAAASGVYANLRVKKANEQLLTIAQNVRQLMGSATSFRSAPGTNISNAMLNAGVFPQSALKQFGTAAAPTYNTISPWEPTGINAAMNAAGTNGHIRIYVDPNLASRFVISYQFVNNASTQAGRTKDCNAFLAANLSNGPAEIFNGTAWVATNTVGAETVTCGTFNGLYGAHFSFDLK